MSRSSAGNLRNIVIEDTKVQILSMDPCPRILIRWELQKTTQNLKNLKFVIFRGESPEELKAISPEIAHDDLYEYVDTEPALRVFSKNYYYKIEAREYRSNAVVQCFESELATYNIEMDKVGMYIVEEHEFKYRFVGGMPVIIIKNRRDGTYCPNCWDKVLKRVTKSNCEVCYGTGKLNGFFKGIPTWMDMNPSPEVMAVTEFGEKSISQRDGELTNYPLLDNRDIIIEVINNRIWKVESIHPVLNRHQAPIRQLIRLSEVNKTDIEYRVPVDEELKKSLVDEYYEITRENEF